MEFVEKLGEFVNRQAAEWQTVHEVQQKHPNAVVGLAESCRRAVAHWGMVSLVVICLATQGLLEGRWTVEVARADLLPLVVKMMAAVWAFQVVLDYAFQRLTKWRCVGYLFGICMGAVVFAMNLEGILQFASSYRIAYLSGLFKVWAGCVCVEYLFGPMFQIKDGKK